MPNHPQPLRPSREASRQGRQGREDVEILPPDRAKEALVKLYEAMKACGAVDWSRAETGARLNALVMLERIGENFWLK